MQGQEKYLRKYNKIQNTPFSSLQKRRGYGILSGNNALARSLRRRKETDMFSIPHLAVLVLTVILADLCGKWARRWDRSTAERFFKVIAIVMLFFDPTYWTWEWTTTGTIDLAMSLPLYICSLFWLLLPVAVYARDGIIKRSALSCICTVCMMGGTSGLVFNIHIGREPFFSFAVLYSLIYHMVMILVIVMMWTSGYYKPRRSDRYLCVAPVILLVLVNLPLNWLYGWDYCYTAGGPGTPFELLSRFLPQIPFLVLLYGGMTLLLGCGFYPWILKRKAK